VQDSRIVSVPTMPCSCNVLSSINGAARWWSPGCTRLLGIISATILRTSQPMVEGLRVRMHPSPFKHTTRRSSQLEPLAEPLAEEPWRTHISRTDRHQQDSSYLIPNGSCQQRTPWAIVLVGQAQRVWVCLSQATATIYASKFVPKLSNRSGGFCHKDAGVVSATSWVGIWEISGQTREPRYETIPYRLVYSWF